MKRVVLRSAGPDVFERRAAELTAKAQEAEALAKASGFKITLIGWIGIAMLSGAAVERW